MIRFHLFPESLSPYVTRAARADCGCAPRRAGAGLPPSHHPRRLRAPTEQDGDGRGCMYATRHIPYQLPSGQQIPYRHV
eukprot:5844850-Prymnesium_polylepis.2